MLIWKAGKSFLFFPHHSFGIDVVIIRVFMADIDAYKDKFSESGRRVLDSALDESKKRDQNYVAIEHILHAVANEEDELFTSTMRDLAVDPRSARLTTVTPSVLTRM